MAGTLETISKLKSILRPVTNLSVLNLSLLLAQYDVDISDSSLSRFIAKDAIPPDIDKKIRPIILRIEDLIERAKPFRIALDDVLHIKLILDLLDDGADYQVGEPLSVATKGIAVKETRATSEG